ncbi:MAG: hypothetical protein AAF078_10005 [Planctomycetota bacterium]
MWSRWLVAVLAVACLSALALVSGCGLATDSASGREVENRVATRTFSLGDPAQYEEPGVYDDFHRSHGVWVVSRDTASGRMIVVLAAQAPGVDGLTHFSPAIGKFRCATSGSRFTRDGLLSGSSGTATHSLERLRLEYRHGELTVVPTRRYAQEENDWSSPFCLFILDSETHPDLETPAGEGFDRRPRLRPTHSFFGGG